MENKNKGVRLSSPSVRYVAILDDDDTYLPRFLERTVEALDFDSELMAVTTDCELRSQDGKFIKYYPHGQRSFWFVGLGGGSVIRKDIFTKFGIWWDRDMVFEDWDFGLRVAKNHKVGGISEPLRIYYRYHMKMGESMSTMYNKTTPQEVLERFYNKYKDVFRAAGPEAFATVHGVTGKMLVRAGHAKAGRKHLWESFRLFPTVSAFAYWVISCVAPSAFTSVRLMIWKNKIKGMFKK